MEGWRGRHRDSPPYVVPTAASALAGRCLKGERRPWRREPAAAAARSLTQSSLLRTQDRLSDKYTERVGGEREACLRLFPVSLAASVSFCLYLCL